ncbi:MAG TPA: serine hydrolase domain-containing protein [Gemmatimonadaceae bacterium]|nr:serine hydrolase domain-containing protein [Gemmatimonadaceae bacterium]
MPNFLSFFLSCSIALTVVAAPAPALTQQLPVQAIAGQSPVYGTAIDRARAIVRDSMTANGVPGISVAVAVDGKVVWTEGFGFADIENRVPLTPETRMRIGSVSKSVTSAAIGLLVEEGKLDLDAPVQRYVPAFPRKPREVTTRQLAGHLAGIRHYRGNEMLSARPYESVTSSLDIFKDDTLLHPPGSRYFYSSYGWNLLSAVVEGAAGERFLTVMRQRVFEPLGLRSIVAEHMDSLIPFRARYYERGVYGALRNAPYVDNSYKWAGGGFISNTEDLVLFGSALLQPGFLEARTLATMFTPMHTTVGEDTRYAIGWRVDTDSAGRREIAHSGTSVGANAFLALYPEQRVVVAILSNTTARFVGAGTGGRQIAALFMPR